MIGLEFVTDRESLDPAPKIALDFLNELFEHNILIGKGGLYGNVIRIQPPMCLSKADVEYAIYYFDKVLEKIAK